MYKISISQSMTYFKTKNVFSSLNKVFFCILRKFVFSSLKFFFCILRKFVFSSLNKVFFFYFT